VKLKLINSKWLKQRYSFLSHAVTFFASPETIVPSVDAIVLFTLLCTVVWQAHLHRWSLALGFFFTTFVWAAIAGPYLREGVYGLKPLRNSVVNFHDAFQRSLDYDYTSIRTLVTLTNLGDLLCLCYLYDSFSPDVATLSGTLDIAAQWQSAIVCIRRCKLSTIKKKWSGIRLLRIPRPLKINLTHCDKVSEFSPLVRNYGDHFGRLYYE
jgi:hypothetical protein